MCGCNRATPLYLLFTLKHFGELSVGILGVGWGRGRGRSCGRNKKEGPLPPCIGFRQLMSNPLRANVAEAYSQGPHSARSPAAAEAPPATTRATRALERSASRSQLRRKSSSSASAPACVRKPKEGQPKSHAVEGGRPAGLMPCVWSTVAALRRWQTAGEAPVTCIARLTKPKART